MRKVTAHLFSSLDGIVSSPNLFQFDSFGQEEGEIMGSALAPITDVLLGRTMYEEWVGYFPHSQDPFAEFINPVRKHVVSHSLTGPYEWQHTEHLDGELLETVAAMRRGDGGEISVNGVSVIRQLFLAGLMDALTLTIHPVVAGSGVRLFEEGTDLRRLTLLQHRVTAKGNAILTYGLRAGQ